MTRSWTSEPAVRRAVPVLVGLHGPSGAGKTFSALRVAAGLERISKRPTFVVDTESGRALHYADGFKFVHVPFDPPFDPDSYVEVLRYCHAQGAGQVVVDSISHEWEGEGGVLELHAAELERLSGGDYKKAERFNMIAWNKAKTAHNRLRTLVARSPMHLICCFRAKPKLKMERGKEPVNLGYQPIGGTDILFELMISGLLLPGSKGVPTWRSEVAGEDTTIKIPKQFDQLIAGWTGPLSEDFGEQLGKWAAGGERYQKLASVPPPPAAVLFPRNWSGPSAGKPLESASVEELQELVDSLVEKPEWSPDVKKRALALRQAAAVVLVDKVEAALAT